MKQARALSDTLMPRVGAMNSWPAPSVPALPGRGPALRLYDSADRQVRPVSAGDTATMYVCGITPTTPPTWGTRPPTWPSTWCTGCGWTPATVHYVQNITDVDDPLFERAQRDGVDWRALADREIGLFCEDMAALRCCRRTTTWPPPTRSPR